jgi:hypothetical protein
MLVEFQTETAEESAALLRRLREMQLQVTAEVAGRRQKRHLSIVSRGEDVS